MKISGHKLQTLIEAERATKTQSTVLAVDTSGLSVRSKSASASTKELFEQAAMEHLARLHHTFNSWSDRKQELMGSVSLKLMVDASGNVVRVEPVNSHVNNSSFVKTVIDDVREWKFPKGSAEAAEITVPLLFIPKGMDPEMIVQWERKVRRAPGDDDSPSALANALARPATKVTEKALDIAAITPMQKEQKSVAAAPAQPQIAAKPIAVATVAPTAKAKAQAKATRRGRREPPTGDARQPALFRQQRARSARSDAAEHLGTSRRLAQSAKRSGRPGRVCPKRICLAIEWLTSGRQAIGNGRIRSEFQLDGTLETWELITEFIRHSGQPRRRAGVARNP